MKRYGIVLIGCLSFGAAVKAAEGGAQQDEIFDRSSHYEKITLHNAQLKQLYRDGFPVRLSKQEDIHCMLGDMSKRIIFTSLERDSAVEEFKVKDAVVLAFITKHESGARHVTMNHFLFCQNYKQLECLQEAVGQLNKCCLNGPLLKQLIVLVPGQFNKDEKGHNTVWTVAEKYKKHISELGKIAGVEPVVSMYIAHQTFRHEVYPDFSVELAREGMYWRAFGEGYELKKISE